MGLSREETNQLTKMSLSKIVGNLRQKLKEEESKSKSFMLKVQHLQTEKAQIKEKMDNMKRKEKINVPTMQLHP